MPTQVPPHRVPAARRPALRAAAPACAALLAALLAAPTGAQERLGGITTPAAELGFEIGADYQLATYAQLASYWEKLARESDRMVLDTIGLSEEGRPQLMAILTSPANRAELARYREIAERLARAEIDEAEARSLAARGKAVVWIDGGLHADEVLGAQQLIQLVYDLASLTDAETLRFLDDVIVLAVQANPDGMDLVSGWYMRTQEPTARTMSGLPVLYQKYAGHDNNRDFFMGNLVETRNMSRVTYAEWFPQIVYNHHQTGPPGTVMFAPPFRDPPNYQIHPEVLSNLEQVGAAMQARFIAEDKPGVTTRSGANYSTWWNGGLRTTPYFHNMIGLITETIGHPTPTEIPFFPETQIARNDLPLPVEPGVWHFRQSIDYSETANRAVLDFASRNRETLLLNIWRMGRDAIERGRRDAWINTPREIEDAQRRVGLGGGRADFERLLRRPDDRLPRGYVLRADQPDFDRTRRFVEALMMTGVVVERSTGPFRVGGTAYPQGSFVVRTDQAFAPHALDMFEPQDHPDDFAFPGGPPIPPYDLTGWTLAYQMGIQFDRIRDGFDGPFERVHAADLAAPGRIVGTEQGGFLLDHRVNDAFAVVNGLLAGGVEVSVMDQPVTLGEARYPAGAFFVAGGARARARLEPLLRDLGVDARAVARRPAGTATRLRAPRIGLFDQYGGSIDSGWTRFVLERFGFPFTIVYPRDLDAGNLNARFDVLIFPNGAIPAPGRRQLGPERVPDLPPLYEARMGAVTAERTVPQILDFVRRGGTAVTVGSSTSLAQHAQLPVSSHLVRPDGRPYDESEYFIPGSLLDVELVNGSPTLYGLDDRVTVMFASSPVLRVAPNAPAVRILGRYGAAPLKSGWAWGQEKLQGGVALAEATLGRGTIFLFTPEITFRGQPHGTFPLLFNAIQRAGVAR